MAQGKPVLMIVAGSEGSGKTTHIEQDIPKIKTPGYERPFVSADKVQGELLRETGTRAFGAGNLIAEQQTRELIAQRKSVTYETSFSNPRDVDLVKDAKAAGYHVSIHQVQVKSVELAQARVAERVREGGRDAPASTIRAEFENSPKLVAQASKYADYTFVQDSSRLNEPARTLAVIEKGKIRSAVPEAEMPEWAKKAYAQQLSTYRDGNVSAAEKSFAQAVDRAEKLSPGATVRVAGHQPGEFKGPIVASTQHHELQKTGEKEFVAHFRERLAISPGKDNEVAIKYGADRDKARVEYLAPKPANENEAKADARQFIEKAQGKNLSVQNPRVEAAYSAFTQLEAKIAETNPRTDKVEREVTDMARNSIAARLASGKTVEINRQTVEQVQYQVASKSIDAAVEQKMMDSRSNPRVDPEHRRIVVENADKIARAADTRVTEIKPESPQFKDAQRIAAQLARFDGAKGESPFNSREMNSAYAKQQTDDMRQQNMQQQRQQARGGMER